MNKETLLRRMIRMGDSALEDLLDTLEVGSELFKIVDSELNLRADRATAREEAQKAVIAARQAELQARMAELEALTKVHSTRCMMRAYVVAFGHLYQESYYIDSEHTVFSSAKNPYALEEINQWQHESRSEADAKVEQLIYWRAYDNHVRNGVSSEDLLLIQEALVKILKESA